MDIDSLTKGMALFGTAVTSLKQVIDLLPKGSKKAEAMAALERAAQELKKAEAETAKRLGYQICTNHWPPEIMRTVQGKSDLWRCPVCGEEKDLDWIAALKRR